MQLSEWMRRNEIDDGRLVELLSQHGARCDKSTVNRWRRGVVKPSWRILATLCLVTQQKVTADDFLPE